MPQRVRRQLVEFSAFGIGPIFTVQARLFDVALKYLPKSVLCVMLVWPARWMKQVAVRLSYLIVPLAHPTFHLQKATEFIHQPWGKVACSSMPGLGVLRRDMNSAPSKIKMLELNPHELTDPAAEFIDDLHDEFVPVVVD